MDFISDVHSLEFVARITRQQPSSAWTLFTYGRIKDDFLAVFIPFLAGIVIGRIAMHFAHAERRMEQEQRNRLAERIAVEIERRITEVPSRRAVPDFALYLRPFALETATRSWKLGSGSFRTFFLETGKMNFDYFLQDKLNYLDIPLISIGLPADQEGAGRIVTTDLTWRERFHQLAERATTVVVVPGMQAGILTEIRWLRMTGLLAKTVFFKPKGYPKAYWQKMKAFYESEEGMVFPDYSPKQFSFLMHSSGEYYQLLTWHRVYHRGVPKLGVDQMRGLLANMPDKSD